MSEFDPAPEKPEGKRRWQSDADTFDRVYETVLGVTELTPYADIAEVAGCSPNAAKKHLDRLVGMGITRGDTEAEPARYARDDGYFEWQEAKRIATELSVTEIIDRVEALEEKRTEYEERFDVTDPGSVPVFGREDHDEVHERMREVSDWHRVRRDVRLYELAGQLARNDGHLIRA